MTRGRMPPADLVLGSVAVLLALDLVFVPWFQFSFGPLTFTATATAAPDAWLGVLGVLASLAIAGDLAVERFSARTQLPAINGSREQTRLILSWAAAICVGLKFLLNVHFSLFGAGFYIAVVLAAARVYLALRLATSAGWLGR